MSRNELPWTSFVASERSNYSYMSPSIEVAFTNATSIGIEWKAIVPSELSLRGIKLFLGIEDYHLGNEFIYQAPFVVGSNQSEFVFNNLGKNIYPIPHLTLDLEYFK